MDDSLHSLTRITETGIDLAMRFAPRVVVAIAIIGAGLFAGRWAGRALGRALKKAQLDAPVRALLQRFAEVLVLGLFAIMALQNLGVELLPLVAGLGIAGAGIALAMQGVLGNVVAGLTILLSRPFRVGDYISIVKEEGLVRDITLFNTTLQHADLSRVVIPNRKIVGEILHNYGTLRQIAIDVTLSYQADIRAASAIAGEVLRANTRVLREPAPVVGASRLAESGVVLSVAPWVNVADYGPAGGELTRALLEAFRTGGIAMATPQREVRMLSTTAYVAAQRDAA